ncbi:chondroitin AC/alginate lyase [Didymella exigua CBS 183.55]|uniref:Chondroitin AC/alginate lyase n=1 Tax=Didymella exigua CBS 183.55 TaxID=1150837 RepID=A0A6A5RA78_9PLEO|nr:chondroitin AC/alginate lyase [Didymella exigua CBS 183.55]KAF1924239.1 chondroitin AC/alginate lyase [Didymella exigua CBS 183.55]
MHFTILTTVTALTALANAIPFEQHYEVSKFAHPGALHSSKDIERIKARVAAKDEPWSTAFKHLSTRPLVQTTWKPSPKEVLARFPPGTVPAEKNLTNNSPSAYRDAHSAYGLALRWLVTGNTSFADAATKTLDGWGSTLKVIDGNEDLFLAAGLYGYQFANAAELLRDYQGWPKKNQTVFGNMLNTVFAPKNHYFLTTHSGKPDFYYANWDLCNIASMMAIGIFTDNSTMYNWAVKTFLNGLPDSSTVINGALPYFSIANFTEEGSGKTLMQGQEAGRDQGHATLCFALLGVIGQQGYNQGIDLYGAYGNQILNGAEYAGKFNAGNNSVPYKPYHSWEGILPVVSEKKRFDIRPGFEAIYAHYSDVRGINASWTKAYRNLVNRNLTANIEGGGGDYGPNSGGFDAFGHGTLLYRISGQ